MERQIIEALSNTVTFDSAKMLFRGQVHLSDEDPDELWRHLSKDEELESTKPNPCGGGSAYDKNYEIKP